LRLSTTFGSAKLDRNPDSSAIASLLIVLAIFNLSFQF